MQVKVKLFASFRLKWFKEADKECLQGAEVLDIVKGIGISVNELGIVLVNGCHASLNTVLHDGDVVSLMPLIGGG